MHRNFRIATTIAVFAFAFANPATPQALRMKWNKVFAKPVDWYARTSAGIVVVKAGKSLYAVKEEDGEQLWMLPIVRATGKTKGTIDAAALRGQDILEVPGMGILLMNHVKLDGDEHGRLIALNLATGKRLWDQSETDELMTAVPLFDDMDAVLVSRRRQKKALIAEQGALIAMGFPFSAYFPVVPYPFRFELARIDLASGKTKWNTEYERTFTPGATNIQRLGDQIYIYFGNRVMTAINLADGKFLWEDGKKHLGSAQLTLPVAMANGELIYSSEYVRAVDPTTQKENWSMEDLGKVTGMVHGGGRVVALGDDNMAAADVMTGKEIWRNKTHGHTSNLVWDKASDELIFIDGKGLHRVDAGTGKSLLDLPLHVESYPSYVRQASPDVAVTFAVKEVCAYNLKTGKKLFSEGKLNAFFRPNAAMDNWPMPETGEEFAAMNLPPRDRDEWEHLQKETLLNAEMMKTYQEAMSSEGDFLEAYETEQVGQANKIWWIDRASGQKVEITPSGNRHEMNRRLGMVFAVNNLLMWGASVDTNHSASNANPAGK